MKKLLAIMVLGFLFIMPEKSWAPLTDEQEYGCKPGKGCLKKWCPGKDFNDGKKCYKINDFLSQGYEIKNEQHGTHSNVTYTLYKKSVVGSDKMIICKVHVNSKKTRCHKP